MGLVLIKERRLLFSEFALSKSQYLYNKVSYRTRECVIERGVILSEEKYNSLHAISQF